MNLRQARIATGFDTPNTYQVIDELRANGVETFPSTEPSSLAEPLKIDSVAVYPMGGVANSELVQCNESGFWEMYTSNEFGFNNPRGLWDIGKPIDVMAVGDSFTEGNCVRKGEDLSIDRASSLSTRY